MSNFIADAGKNALADGTTMTTANNTGGGNAQIAGINGTAPVKRLNYGLPTAPTDPGWYEFASVVGALEYIGFTPGGFSTLVGGAVGAWFMLTSIPTLTTAPNIAQQASNYASATSVSATFGSAPSSGNVVALFVNSDATMSATPTGFTQRASFVGQQGVYAYDKVAGASEGTIYTVTPSSAANTDLAALEIGGVTGFDAVGTVGSTQQSAGQSSRSCPTVMASAVGIVFAVVSLHTITTAISGTPTWSNGFTHLMTVGTGATGSTSCIMYIGYKVLTASGAVGATTATWATGNASSTAGYQIVYKASGSSAAIQFCRFGGNGSNYVGLRGSGQLSLTTATTNPLFTTTNSVPLNQPFWVSHAVLPGTATGIARLGWWDQYGNLVEKYESSMSQNTSGVAASTCSVGKISAAGNMGLFRIAGIRGNTDSNALIPPNVPPGRRGWGVAA